MNTQTTTNLLTLKFTIKAFNKYTKLVLEKENIHYFKNNEALLIRQSILKKLNPIFNHYKSNGVYRIDSKVSAIVINNTIVDISIASKNLVVFKPQNKNQRNKTIELEKKFQKEKSRIELLEKAKTKKELEKNRIAEIEKNIKKCLELGLPIPESLIKAKKEMDYIIKSQLRVKEKNQNRLDGKSSLRIVKKADRI